MRVLVTGASGFVGPYLLDRLCAAGHEVVATSGGEADGVRDVGSGLVEWVRLDLRDEESIQTVLASVRPQAIVHLAAISSVARSWDDPASVWEVNATGTQRLARWAATFSAGCRFLYVSSSEVYGAATDGGPVTEDAPPRPTNPYGASKAAGEMALWPWGAAGKLDVIVARSFGHSGAGQSPDFILPNVALQLARIARRAQPPQLQLGNLEVEREILDVRDVVEAYALLLERASSGIYNVCRGVAFRLRDVVSRMIEMARAEVTIVGDAARMRPTETPRLVGDATRLRQLGWRPRYDLDDTLRALLEWAQAHA